jgi:tetratricopeptide (TPR) repeat protein
LLLNQRSSAGLTESRIVSTTSFSHRKIGPVLVIVAAGIVAFANSLGGVFVFDDYGRIVDNPEIEQFPPTRKTLLHWDRPTTSFSLAMNYALGKLNPWGYHAVNVLIHVGAGLALYGLVRRLLLSRRFQSHYEHSAGALALVIALLWLVHPLQTESVTYLTQRTESLMGLFYLLTLYCVCRGASLQNGQVGHKRIGATSWYVLAVLACALGMGSKEVMVTAPLLALLMDRIFFADYWKDLFARRWGLYLCLAATWIILTRRVLVALPFFAASTPESVANLLGLPVESWAPVLATPKEYALTQAGVICYYLRLALCPYPQCIDCFWGIARLPAAIAPLLIVLALLGTTAWALWRYPQWGFWGVWFFLILAPSSSILPLLDPAAEHRMYLPLAAVIVLVVAAVYKLLGLIGSPRVRRRFAIGIGLAGVLLLSGFTAMRNQVYHSNIRLWESVLAQRPANPRGHHNLAKYLKDDADRLRANGNFEQARQQTESAMLHDRRALELMPNYPDAHLQLGVLLTLNGALVPGLEHLRTAVRLNPTDARAHNNLAAALLQLGLVDEAVREQRLALRDNPNNGVMLMNLGKALKAQGKLEEAAQTFTHLIQLEPRSAEPHNQLGLVCLLEGKADEAVIHFSRAVKIKPRHPGYRINLASALHEAGRWDELTSQQSLLSSLNPNWPRAVEQSAWELATGTSSARESKRALQLARLACWAVGSPRPEFLDTQAAAQAACGQFDEAVRTATEAARACSASQAELARQIGTRIELYRKHQPFQRSLNSVPTSRSGKDLSVVK